MEEITVNGTTYVEKTEALESDHVVVIADRGWIFEGMRQPSDSGVKLVNASVVRSWSNGKGIGGIVKEANKGDYKLDAIGTIDIHDGSYIAVFPLEW